MCAFSLDKISEVEWCYKHDRVSNSFHTEFINRGEKIVHMPSFLAFSFEGFARYGFSEIALGRMLHARAKGFIWYEDKSVECARCHCVEVGTANVTLPLFHLVWVPDLLEYAVFFRGELCCFSHKHCPECDVLTRYEHQAIIRVDLNGGYARLLSAPDVLILTWV